MIANVKHFAVNNQEGVRQTAAAPSAAASASTPASTTARSSELYLPQFEAAVEARAAPAR